MPTATLHSPAQRLVRHRSPRTAATVYLLLAGTLACNDLSGLAGKQALPAGTVDPSVYNTAAGALALYQATIAAFSAPAVEEREIIGTATITIGGGTNGAAVNFVMLSGLLADELQGERPSVDFDVGIGEADSLDARQLPEGPAMVTDNLYSALQGIRGGASEGIGALAAYDSGSAALRGHLYALEGYAEIYLADLFCSGVPLSTLNFNGTTSFTYAPSSTTSQVYQDAIAKFDTALTLSADSAQFLNLARVGRGRAFLDLGQYDSAAAAVSSVPQGFTYQIVVNWAKDEQSTGGVNVFDDNVVPASVANVKGINGLPFRSNGDPRDSVQQVGLFGDGEPYYAPLKYGGKQLGVFPLTVADWIEARLIQAEAAYNGVATGSGSWLQQLNALRQTAITPALSVLSDPGSDSARVTMLFQERAYWLFLTGHRQSDLHRLIQWYGRDPESVYPTGLYSAGSQQQYGTDVTAPIPAEESENPYFHGCLSRGA